MKKRHVAVTILVSLCLALVLGGCAKTLSQVKWHDEPVYAEPNAGKALVYFLREKKTIAGGVEARIYDGKQKIGALPNGTYFFYQADPGDHAFTSALDVKDSISIALEAGMTYYVRANAKFALTGSSAKMEVVPESIGARLTGELTYVTLRDIF